MSGLRVGAVVIGRNEGERLQRCLASLVAGVESVVYVDSGSTDGSPQTAREAGVDVVELDLTIPFTAARARNIGFERIGAMHPDIRLVQFVDGDCEVVPGWIDHAADYLAAHRSVGIVCGRRRERFPERSVYNFLCDREWDTPPGAAKSCGGDFMVRVEAFATVGGFRAGMIAGEEPELCVRLRAAGWGVRRLDREMTRHDAMMVRFGQWWTRALRGGHAFAEGAHLHGAPPERHWVQECRRILFWAALLPATILSAFLLIGPWVGLLLAIYPLQVVRLALRGAQPWRKNVVWSFFLVLSNFPGLIGQLRFHARRIANARPQLIEYK
ncbi:MAG: glycosyltransferase [Sulfuritalea sp.]|nr:glycosyltransferase [Sulfuritalea sp.]